MIAMCSRRVSSLLSGSILGRCQRLRFDLAHHNPVGSSIMLNNFLARAEIDSLVSQDPSFNMQQKSTKPLGRHDLIRSPEQAHCFLPR